MRSFDLRCGRWRWLAAWPARRRETYPSRPITIIVPFPAGGPTDTMARIMADHMKDTLGQTILVENVTGAGATIGVGRVGQRGAGRLHARSSATGRAMSARRALYPVSWQSC